MKRFINAHKKAVAAVAAVAIVAGSGVGAYAYWTSSGGGTGSASTAAAGNSNLTVTATSEASPNTMGPNIAPEKVTVTITNPAGNTQSSYVTSVKAAINDGGTTWNVGPPACTHNDYQVQAATSAALSTAGIAAGAQSVVIPVGTELAPGTTTTASFYFGFVDDSTNQTACEGQSVALTYTTA